MSSATEGHNSYQPLDYSQNSPLTMSSDIETPSSQPIYRQDVPHSIQEKIRLLALFETQIGILETQLKSIKEECALLEAIVEPYRIREPEGASLTTIRDATYERKSVKCPISRCPNEVLYLIFREYLIPRHRNIGKLLFVCKRWNAVVLSSPGLWARIHVPFALNFFQDPQQGSEISFISACILRSHNLLLDVELKLWDLPHHSGYIANRLENYAMEVVMLGDDDEDSITDQIGCTNWNYYAWNYEDTLKKFMESIFGINGIHITRWAALNIDMPWEVEAAKRIWRSISVSLPNLKKLIISGLNKEIYQSSTFNTLKLPALESITITSTTISGPIPLTLFQVPTNSLTYLSLGIDKKLQNIGGISLLTSLQTLELLGTATIYGNDDTWLPPAHSTWPVYTIHLPQLIELTLGGPYEGLKAVRFDLPLLDKLTIRSCDTFEELPTLSPQQVHWYIKGNSESAWDRIKILVALHRIAALPSTSLIIPELVTSKGLSSKIFFENDAEFPHPIIHVKHKNDRIEVLEDEKAIKLLKTAKVMASLENRPL